MSTRLAGAGRVAMPLCLLLCAVPAHGPSAAEPESIMVTGSRLPGAVRADDSNVTVLDRAQIKERHASSVVELLRTIPGMVVEQAGGRGSVASVFTRGAKPNFTLVLLDGVRLNDPTNTRGGSFDFATLSLDDIDRVEIIRGPSSAIYGSDAVGGVINIITRKGTDHFTGDAEAAIGQYGFWQSAAELRGPVAGATASLGVSRLDNGRPVDGSQFRGSVLNGSVTAAPWDRAKLVLTGRYSVSDAASFPDSSGGPLLAVIRDLDRRQIDEGILGAALDLNLASWLSQGLAYGLYGRSSDETSPGVAPSAQDPSGVPRSTDAVTYRRNEITWINRASLDPDAALVLGLDTLLESGVDDGALFFGRFQLPTRYALDRTIWSGFSEARYAPFAFLEVSAGAREDVPTHAPAHFSPKLAARGTSAATGTVLELDWGEGFKLPSLYALGNPLVGDPHLLPEQSRSLEAGLTQELGVLPGRIKLNAYDTHYADLIDFDPVAFKLVNLSQARMRGGELALEVEPAGRVNLSPFLAYSLARNQATGAPLRDVPRWQAGGTLRWQAIDNVTVALTAFHVGSLIDNSVPTGDVRLPGYQRVDCAVTWAFRADARVYVAVENLLDAQYQEAIGFPAPGLVARTGLALSF